MSEGNFDRELIKAGDYNGWEYSLMSSFAVSGSVMPAILPYESEMVPGYKQFYKKWMKWAKDTFDYVNATDGFGYLVFSEQINNFAYNVLLQKFDSDGNNKSRFTCFR